MKPIIGITPYYDCRLGCFRISPFYANAVEASGGIPLILNYSDSPDIIEGLTDSLDGIIFSGGDNVSPSLYGEKTSPSCGPIEYERDLFELALCRSALKKDKSVLGICRGCQLIAVALGGTLIQQVDNHLQASDRHVASHSVKVFPNTLLHSILRADISEVNSFHRQAVNTSGEMKCAALSNDGVTEAVFLPDKKFFLGVQWHPERMYAHSFHAKLLFSGFISSCCP